MGHLQQDTRSVAGVRFTATSAAMCQVSKDSQGLTYDLVRFFAFDIDDKSCAAGIMLKIRVIQPLLRGQASRVHAGAILF